MDIPELGEMVGGVAVGVAVIVVVGVAAWAWSWRKSLRPIRLTMEPTSSGVKVIYKNRMSTETTVERVEVKADGQTVHDERKAARTFTLSSHGTHIVVYPIPPNTREVVIEAKVAGVWRLAVARLRLP